MAGNGFLETWFAAHCNGDWEHDFIVRIETLDNPGWSVEITVTSTELEGIVIPSSIVERSEDDWVSVSCDGQTFKAYGGPFNLQELLDRFRQFAESQARPTI